MAHILQQFVIFVFVRSRRVLGRKLYPLVYGHTPNIPRNILSENRGAAKLVEYCVHHARRQYANIMFSRLRSARPQMCGYSKRHTQNAYHPSFACVVVRMY